MNMTMRMIALYSNRQALTARPKTERFAMRVLFGFVSSPPIRRDVVRA